MCTPIKCIACDQYFTEVLFYKEHLDVYHSYSVSKSFQKCLFCDQLFWNMKKHLYLKHPFVCDVSNCQKTFLHKRSLTRHKHLHAGRVFDCKICARKFKRRYLLKAHVDKHHFQWKNRNKSNEKQFIVLFILLNIFKISLHCPFLNYFLIIKFL